jgi:hypothetical protein
MTAEVQCAVGEHVADWNTESGELAGETGQQLLECALTAGEQCVGMPVLGCATPRCVVVWEIVAVDDHDLVVGVRQGARCEHSGDAGAQHDRSASTVWPWIDMAG